jgi:hypothetical protein
LAQFPILGLLGSWASGFQLSRELSWHKESRGLDPDSTRCTTFFALPLGAASAATVEATGMVEETAAAASAAAAWATASAAEAAAGATAAAVGSERRSCHSQYERRHDYSYGQDLDDTLQSTTSFTSG